MDENEFREVYRNVNELRCVYEKAALTRRFGCEKLVKMNIAEREAAGCSDIHAQRRCDALQELLRRNAAFALHLTHVSGPLPHGKEVKVQCGGLLGLQRTIQEGEQSGVANIYALIEQALTLYGDLESLPFGEIVKSVTHYQGRRRRGHKDT